jgi:G8 domain
MKSNHAPRFVGQRMCIAIGLTFAVGTVACNPSSSDVNVGDGSNINNSSTDTTGNVVATAKWSDPLTWGGTVPAAGSNVTIPANKAILLDKNISIQNLTIMGKLEFADQNLELDAASIMLHGTLRVGASTKPFTKKASITLNETNTATDNMGMGARGILIMGGTLELHGQAPAGPWTKIGDHVTAGGKTLGLLKAVGMPKPANAELQDPNSDYELYQQMRFSIHSCWAIHPLRAEPNL